MTDFCPVDPGGTPSTSRALGGIHASINGRAERHGLMVYFQCQINLQRRPAEAAYCMALASGRQKRLNWSLALACGSWLPPRNQLFMSLQASLIIQRTSPLRSQSFPAKASAWNGPLTPVQTPRGSRDEVCSCPLSPQPQHRCGVSLWLRCCPQSISLKRLVCCLDFLHVAACC